MIDCDVDVLGHCLRVGASWHAEGSGLASKGEKVEGLAC